MVLFQKRQTEGFQARLAELFTPATLAYIQYPDQTAVAAGFQMISRQFISTNNTKLLGMITLPDAAIVPYLTVRSNILINGQHRSFDLVPEHLRKDTTFLDTPADGLTATQSLYIQLFRGLVAGRTYLVMSDFPAAMTLQERRIFLDYAKAAVAQADACLIVLTTDAQLIAANPATSWRTPPELFSRISV
ncbi:hypothetical protein [Lacticaseibacillus jixiensis]|uniref:hypothetical protein n=1 Tax=Lacticaseibacillus jixiensis TaxID=3231926 RepID=UPI0036F3B71C